jgi:membrane protease YdiL (CAAX protease family)
VQEAAESEPRVHVAWLFVALGLLGLVIVFGLSLGGEASQFAQQGALSAPVLILAGLLQLARLWAWARLAAWGWFWLLLLGLGVFTLLLTVGALQFAEGGNPPTEQVVALLVAGGLIFVSFVLAAVLAGTGGWYPLGRAFGARLEPRETAHAQGLVGLLFAIVASIVPLIVLGGRAPLLLLVEHDESFTLGNRTPTGQILDLYYTLAWTIPLAILAAGAPVRRTLRAAFGRLGLLRLGWRDPPILAAVALGLVLLAFAVDGALARIWEQAGWPRTDADLVERLFGATISPAGAVGVAVSAGVGEELIARGLLQPRFGWFLPNLAFAMAHAFQYGPDGVLSVFLTGAALAWVRARWNTTAAAFTHSPASERRGSPARSNGSRSQAILAGRCPRCRRGPGYVTGAM